jgi:hypothetical protein
MNNPKKIKVIVEKTNTGFSAYCESLSVFTEAPSVNQLYDALIEALNFHYEEDGITITKEVLNLNFDFRTFFQNYKAINARFLAERIGMNQSLLAQYTSGVKTPSEKQLKKIVEGIHSIGEELNDLTLLTK